MQIFLGFRKLNAHSSFFCFAGIALILSTVTAQADCKTAIESLEKTIENFRNDGSSKEQLVINGREYLLTCLDETLAGSNFDQAQKFTSSTVECLGRLEVGLNELKKTPISAKNDKEKSVYIDTYSCTLLAKKSEPSLSVEAEPATP